jgi:hypothetical protein
MAGCRVRYTLAAKLINELVEAADDRQLTFNESFSKAHMFCANVCKAVPKLHGFWAVRAPNVFGSLRFAVLEGQGQPDGFFVEAHGGIEMARRDIRYSGMQSEMP